MRQPGQGGDADKHVVVRDLRQELLLAEAAHFAKVKGRPAGTVAVEETGTQDVGGPKRLLEGGEDQEEEDLERKRRRVLEETRDIDADSEDDGEDDSSDDDDRWVTLISLCPPAWSDSKKGDRSAEQIYVLSPGSSVQCQWWPRHL